MSKNVHTEAVNHLFDAILSLENKEECYRFFEDVCTVNELLSLSQRYEVARMLQRTENLSGYCRKNRSFYCNDQPCQPLVKLRK